MALILKSVWQYFFLRVARLFLVIIATGLSDDETLCSISMLGVKRALGRYNIWQSRFSMNDPTDRIFSQIHSSRIACPVGDPTVRIFNKNPFKSDRMSRG